jgi:LPXTG-motif cell wall-anchored protein
VLEIIVIGGVLAALALWLLARRRKQEPPKRKADTYVCPRCGDKDCHCELRS